MKDPETLEELCDYIAHYADSIFIREQIDGKWGSFSLAEVSGSKAIEHALRFIKERTIPIRVLSEDEIAMRTN